MKDSYPFHRSNLRRCLNILCFQFQRKYDEHCNRINRKTARRIFLVGIVPSYREIYKCIPLPTDGCDVIPRAFQVGDNIE